ncbi:hypothetical protein AXG93_3040s1000 [Marchantia polymorpha subsp. ruderalis]|uniref:Tyrosine specific protein phosphatases domain-containing protein n=1 Tax=Marchantia polymorpha subsp. ruderalis TaxID=1480154 RepID=A0A176W0Z4_MARPO|nr:hypothetical protein AXG93_3040s1000 [Marchantia polymorpha subsp. ruderalis]
MAISAAAASVRCSAVPVAAPTGCRRFDGRSGKLASVRFCGGVSAAQSLRAMAALDSRSESLQSQKMQVMANAGKTDETEVEKKTENYTDTMQQAMGTGLTYRHELGMNYAHVLPDLIVGSCLQTPADVDRLKEAGVVDIEAIINHAKEVDGIEHIRAQIRDFDPYDLRQRLPQVIATLYQATKKNEGTAYVHCTAGLGRAPAVALTYMYWIRGYDLFEANAMLQKVRTCHPKLDSIKAATADLLTGNSKEKVKLAWYRGAAQSVEVAGLDVGWYEVGKYEFKYIVDGNWCTNPDASSTQPNNDGHVNNFIEVKGNKESWDLRQRIMAGDFVLTDEHRQIIKAKLEALAG